MYNHWPLNLTFMKDTFNYSLSFLSFLCLLLLGSCDTAEQLASLKDADDIQEEAVTEAYFQDLDDMASVVVAAPDDQAYSGGRTDGTVTIEDNRFACEGVVVTLDANNTTEHPSGTLTVDFGTSGCADQKGNVRKGKLIFTYNGDRFTPGATIVTTTENYSINDVKLEGTRTLTNLTESTAEAPKLNVTLANGKATFSDGRIAERESNITWSWIRAANPVEDQLIIHQNSTANGKTGSGKQYVVTLQEQLIYQRFCGIAVSGIKHYEINGEREIIIDYGDGECDRSIDVTVGGKTRTITF